ncbi:hypothetical protein AcV5_008643 [Taiwanofungus camphoratus]|nr:hypothetical protein AcV5_008643 [Antrodia cinnamomea]
MKPASGTRKPYSGTSRSLVLALDIGTTFSGVSYAILEPGEVPKIHGVTRFPGQEHVAGNSKIPSIMYYDKFGKMKAAGAEAESASTAAQAEDEGWFKAELFKLRLRPKSMKLKMNGMRLAPLPRNKTAVDVFGDFLAYLFRCTRSFIVDTHANGPGLWRAVEHDIQFVLSHPNGWEGAQQTKMRRAAVYGGLIPDTDEGKARIRFVTEGEASLHACVLNGLAADVLQSPSGHGFIVADAGGGTLDISSYAIRGTAPLVIEEIAPPDCVFAGSVFVSRRARAFFEEKLKTSKYGTPDSLDHITKRFDETTKRLFRDNKELQFVPFGSPLDKDFTVGIRGGQLKLTGAEVAALFEPSIEASVASIKAQIDASGGTVKSVWLVGGFAASPWLFSQLQERLSPFSVTVSRPDSQTSKAVADGAIGFYCDHHVSARMSKFMYGVEYLREFDSQDAEHVSRKHRLFELPSGPRLLPDAFDCILSRGVRVKESTVFSRKYCTEVTNLSTLSVFEVEIWCFRGGDTIPKWIIRDAENFSTLCYVRADLSPLAGSAQSKQGKNGKTYWTIVFSIEIHFGLTEFRARIKWVDNGRTKYGPASIVYNESGHRAEEDEPDSSPEDNLTVLSTNSDRVPSQQPSHYASRAPSRDPAPSSSRSVHSVQPSPKLPSMETAPRELSRSVSGHSTARSEARAPSDKGKAREAVPEVVRSEPLRESDRSVNLSGRSADSARSGSTRLAEALTSVWGSASKHQSPVASPVVETRRSELATPRNETKVATPRDETRVATPREASKVPTPKEASTPREIPKDPTPKEISKAPTPKEVSKAPTPKEVSKAPTPKEASKAPTPKEVSKAPTPREISRAVTPKALSKFPTPKETSRAVTPKATSAVGTPKPVAETLVEAKPGIPIAEANTVLDPPAEEPPAVPTETTVDSTPAPAETMQAEGAATDSFQPSDPAAGVPATGADTEQLWSTDPPGGFGSFDNTFSFNSAGEHTGDQTSGVGLNDLLSSPGPDPASGAGGFSGFLSSGWGAGRLSSTFGEPTSTFGGGGFLGGFGSGLSFGTSAPATSDAVKAAEEKTATEKADEERRQKEEEENKRLEEEARQKDEEKQKADEEATKRKAEEEAKRAEGEEASRKIEEAEAEEEQAKQKAGEDAKKIAEDAEAAKKAEEEAIAARKADEEVETAKKAEEEAEMARKAKEEANQQEEAKKAEEAKAKEEEEKTQKEESAKTEEEDKAGKKNKKKKTSKVEEAATPEAVSRTASAATTATANTKQSKNAKKNAKKKAKKKGGKGGGDDEDDEEGGGDPSAPVTPGGDGTETKDFSGWGNNGDEGEGGEVDGGWNMVGN